MLIMPTFSNITYERISVGDLMYPVLNEEALFISFVIYIYNYFSRKSAYILSRKNRLCYFYDFYKLCKIIEYKEHFKKHQNKYEHELKTVFIGSRSFLMTIVLHLLTSQRMKCTLKLLTGFLIAI